ncbi:MAG: dihydroorotate dehydrogenase, partial [Deltaproteobacteria bacterium CG_4_9_14_3_um_filter_51_14]
MTEADLGVEIAGVKLKNPVIAASGTFGYGEEYAGLFDINSLGGLVVKGISLKPRQGNPPP